MPVFLGKNDFFQKPKNPNLGFGQSDADSDFQGCSPKNEVTRPFKNLKIAVLAVFLGKNDFFQKQKKPFFGSGQSDVDSDF